MTDRTDLEEIRGLDQAVDLFVSAMRAKLAGKATQGWRGWDDPAFAEVIREKLFEHVERLRNGEGQEIDIANLAMMLWHQRVGPLLEDIYYGPVPSPHQATEEGK